MSFLAISFFHREKSDWICEGVIQFSTFVPVHRHDGGMV